MADIFKTEKGNEIEIVVNQAGDLEPVRTTKNIEAMRNMLSHCEKVVLKAKDGSLRKKLATGKINAINVRLSELV